MEVTFYETTSFSQEISSLKADEQLAQLKEELARNPEKGDLIRATGGFRKVRMRLPGRGKSGGARAIYYYLGADEVIYFVALYAKNVQVDLTAKQKKKLKELSEIITAKIQEAKNDE